MDNERIREICMGLPHVVETVNWGHHLVYWAGDREIGGKMFAMTDLDGTGAGVLWFHCGAERFHELLENDGIVPSPYLAKAFWVTLERWDALRPREIEEELRRAHALIFESLPSRTRTILAMPEAQRKKLIRDRKKLLSAQAREPRSKAVKRGKERLAASKGWVKRSSGEPAAVVHRTPSLKRLRQSYGQVSVVVHSPDSVLAAGVAGPDCVSDRVAAAASVPNRWDCGRRGTGTGGCDHLPAGQAGTGNLASPVKFSRQVWFQTSSAELARGVAYVSHRAARAADTQMVLLHSSLNLPPRERLLRP
jgi:predicted DNA-binding protein (MmcQ/YjbR family)